MLSDSKERGNGQLSRIFEEEFGVNQRSNFEQSVPARKKFLLTDGQLVCASTAVSPWGRGGSALIPLLPLDFNQ